MAKISVNLIPRGQGGSHTAGSFTDHWDSGRMTDEFLSSVNLACTQTLRNLGRAHTMVEVIRVRFSPDILGRHLNANFKAIISQPLYPDQKAEAAYNAEGVCYDEFRKGRRCACEYIHPFNWGNVAYEFSRLITMQIKALLNQATMSVDKMKAFLPEK